MFGRPFLYIAVLMFGVVFGLLIPVQWTHGQNQVPPDTLPTFRYDFGVSTGYSRIADANRKPQRYFSLSLLPELYYRSFGIGLHARIHVKPWSTEFRREDFDSARDYLALLYFLEYGREDDSTGYGRIGSLEEASLGDGHFIDRYTNAIRLDDPMRGLNGTVYTDNFRFEGVYNELADPGVFGLHSAYFPFGTEDTSLLPRFKVGVALAGDLDDDGAQVNPRQPGEPFLLRPLPADSLAEDVPIGVNDGMLFMMGVDAGIRWLRSESVSLLSFVEASKIFDYGVGMSIGLRGGSDVGRLQVEGQYALRFLGKEFLPNFFGPTYEVQRIRSVSLPVGDGEEVAAVNTRRNELAGRRTGGSGYEARIHVDYEDSFESTVGYETLWNEAESGRFTLDFRLHSPEIPVSVRLGYDRFDMNDFWDIVVLSREDALYRLGVAYQIIPPLRLGIDVRQTYEPLYRNGETVGRIKQNRFEPFIQFALRL